jgi:hypothetical protein
LRHSANKDEKGAVMRQNCLVAALVALPLLSAPPAVAEIRLKGDAKMGLSFDANGLKAISAARVTAHAYGTTDGGLEYGMVLDLDITNYSDDPPRGQVYISSGNHRLRVGSGVDPADHQGNWRDAKPWPTIRSGGLK